MNHYERLKVTQDAPPEVIRAAYRALALALPDDAQREAQLRALNTAYETLIDPETRQAYDTVLAVLVPDIEVDAAPPDVAAAADADLDLDIALDALAVPGMASLTDAGAADDELADPWQSVYDAPALEPPRPLTRQPVVWVGGALALLIVIGAGIWLWQLYKSNQFTQGMALPYGAAASGVSVPEGGMPRGTPSAGAASGVLSVDELSRLSDEELLQVLPTLGEASTSGSVRGLPSVATPRGGRGAVAGRHPLDGTPLNLRTEGVLIDPLAPDTAPKPAARPR